MPIPVSSKTGRAYGHVPGKIVRVHPPFHTGHVLLPHFKLPAEVSLLQWMPPVWDQGQEGSCTAFGAKETREWMSARYPGKYVPLSAQFQYYCERLLQGDTADDTGSSVSTAMLSMQMFGICTDTADPYTVPLSQQPTKAEFAAADEWKVGKVYALNTLADMKNALSQGFVFELGFLVYESFESNATAATGVMTMPAPTESLLGGHAACVWGYNDDFAFPGLPSGALCIRNSWGPTWGNNGNFFMPYGYLGGVDPNGGGPYVSDCHMCHLGPHWS